MIDRNVIVYDSGAGGMFLGYSLAQSSSYIVTDTNEYLPDGTEEDNMFSVGDQQINHFNGLTTTHPYEVEDLKRTAKKLDLSFKLIAIILGDDELDMRCRFFLSLLFEIKHRIQTGVNFELTQDITDGFFRQVQGGERNFLSPLGSKWDATIKYKKLFADFDLDEITRLISLTEQNIKPERMRTLIQDYTIKNIEQVEKYAPHLKGYFMFEVKRK